MRYKDETNQQESDIWEFFGQWWKCLGFRFALKNVIEDKNYFNPVYIYGEEGVGKSHLLNATNNALLSEQNKVILLSAESLTYHLVENLTNSEFDYILIDDLNLMPKDDILEEQVAMLIEENKKQLVISSTVDPKVWKFVVNYRIDYNGD